MASRDTLWFPAAEVTVNESDFVSTDGDTAQRASLYAESAISALLLIDGKDTLFFVLEQSTSSAGLDTRCRLTLLADQWQAEDKAILLSPNDMNS